MLIKVEIYMWRGDFDQFLLKELDLKLHKGKYPFADFLSGILTQERIISLSSKYDVMIVERDGAIRLHLDVKGKYFRTM